MTPPPATTQACQGTNKRGQPCGAGVRVGQAYCFQHDPERAVEAAAARVKGGANSKKPAPPAPLDLSSPEAQRKAVEATIDRMRRGDEPVNMARTAIYGIQVARAIIDDTLVKRLDALEEAMGVKR